MVRSVSSLLLIVAGFSTGLLLASMNHILPAASVARGPWSWAVAFVDWIAPPLAGALLAGALLYAQRTRRLHDAERAAAQVLAERLAGTERRQALWVVAAAVAHDLKNPLHNLQLLVEELDEDQDAASRAALLARIRENVNRATDRLSELSRAGVAPGDPGRGIVDLSLTLEDLRQRLASAAAAGRTSVEILCPRGLSIRAEAHALRSAVENVAANGLEALQARGGGGRLRVRAEQLNSIVALEIEDDGPGIPEPLRAQLFTPFSGGTHPGRGLGLAIARALARAGGGDLACTEASPGKTTFRFTFQAARGINSTGK